MFASQITMNEAAKWYVAHTYSGYENKVKDSIEKTVENRNMHDLVEEVLIPMENVAEETEAGEKRIVSRKQFPGYVFIKMVMTDETWYIVRNTRGCTGFVGPGSKPVPLSEDEVYRLGAEARTAAVELNYAVGDTVNIVDGSMEGFLGRVMEIDMEKQKVTVMVTMFGGREMPVELEFYQVEIL